jgi:hypothetical protein
MRMVVCVEKGGIAVKKLSVKTAKGLTVQEVHVLFIRKCLVRNLEVRSIEIY